MSDKVLEKVVIALGYFDSMHLGHQKVIGEAKKLADELSCKLVVFSFKGNLKAMLSGEKDKCVYNVKERETMYRAMGADEVYFAPVDFTFLSLGKLAFLNKINKKYDIQGYVCGADYKFGKFATGTIDDLKKFAEGKDQKVLIVDDVLDDEGKKISTTRIKKMLDDGNIEKANAMLGSEFFIAGKVEEDRGVGSKLGCPTANISIDKDKQRVKDGVYAGKVIVDDKIYLAVINYGPRPTFGLDEKRLEAHLLDFDENIYGKTVKVIFDRFLRPIVKFYSTEQLQEQLNKDILAVREGTND